MAGTTFAEKQRRAKDAQGGRAVSVAPPTSRTPTLTVGHAFDPAEAEADRIADSVIAKLRSGESEEHRHTAACDHGVQRAVAPAGATEVGLEGGPLSPGLSSAIESQRGRGSALPTGVRQRMESAFGRDLGNVSIHTDERAADLSRAVSARAFTTGNDIFFGANQFRPDTPTGEHMLAHELAHTVQQGSGVARTAIHRWWDFRQDKLDWSKARGMRTLKTRNVWFIEDNEGDEVVVKIENQPLGLGELTGEIHGSFGTARSVLQKRLTGRDRAWVAGMLEDDAVARGNSWADYAAERGNAKTDPWLRKVGGDAPTPNQQGRAMALHALRETKDGELMAMTMASGKTAEQAAKPNEAGQGKQGDSIFRDRLTNLAHAKQLGRITAVDLFLGNEDRVLAGNMGNWFYDPAGAVTLIDHVDQGTGMARKFLNTRKGAWAETTGALLASNALEKTAQDCIEAVAGAANKKDPGFTAWLNEKPVGDKSRAQDIYEAMIEGLREERKQLIKVFTSTRFTVGGGKDRAKKKELKAVAQKANAEDQGHAQLGGGETDYYQTLKSRAAWMKSH